MPVYASREIAKVGDDKLKRSKLFFELLNIHLFFTFLLLTIYVVSIFMYPDLRQYKEIALLGGGLILFNVFSIEWLFTGVNDFKYITLRSLLIRGLSIVAILLFVKEKDDFGIYFTILFITVFFTILVDVYHARNFITAKIVLSLKGVKKHLKPIFILGTYMVLTSIYSVLPATLLGFLSTKSAVGYYYGANRIIRMVISVFTSLITVMIPRLNLILEQNEKEEYRKLVEKSLNIVISIGIPITFFIYLLARPIVLVLAGAKFENSIIVIEIMSPIILIVAFAQVFVLLVLSVNRKDNQMVMLSAIGMAISLVINIVFIPHFAEMATGYSQLIAEFLVTFVSFFLAKKVLDFNFPVKKILLNILFVLPFMLIIFLIHILLPNNFLTITVSGIVCSIYFFSYQLLILKDKIVLEISELVIRRSKKAN